MKIEKISDRETVVSTDCGGGVARIIKTENFFTTLRESKHDLYWLKKSFDCNFETAFHKAKNWILSLEK